MTELINPNVAAILFFSERELTQGGIKSPITTYVDMAGESGTVEEDGAINKSFFWKLNETDTAKVDWNLAHDTQILRLSVLRAGNRPLADWSEQHIALEVLLKGAQASGCPIPWGMTLLYSAGVKVSFTSDSFDEIQRIVAPEASDNQLSPCELTPFGFLWKPGARQQEMGGKRNMWVHILVLLTPTDRYERVQNVFLQPLTQGLSRIELYLQKGLHHTRQHEAVRSALESARVDLQEEMLVALRTVDFQQVHHEQQALEEVSRKLMIFLAEKAQTEVLLNSLRSNLQSFNEHLERMQLDTPIYTIQSTKIKREIEQLESDLVNVQAVSDSAYTLQDIQRSIEGNRLERAGVLLGAAAAILAGLAIFNNFLDIWNLSVEKSGLTLPSPWLRVLLGSAAGIFLPLGAYWAVKHLRWQAVLALLIGLVPIVLAVVFTVMVNR